MDTDTGIIKNQINTLVKRDQRNLYRDIAVEALKTEAHVPQAARHYHAIKSIEAKMKTATGEAELERMNRERTQFYVEYGRAVAGAGIPDGASPKLQELLRKNDQLENQIKALGEQLLQSAGGMYAVEDGDQGFGGQRRRYFRFIMMVLALLFFAAMLYMMRDIWLPSNGG